MKNKKPFDQIEWDKQLKQIYDDAIKKKNELKDILEKAILNIDPIELLSHISLLTQYGPEGDSQDFSLMKIREIPLLHFLTGYVLKNKKIGTKIPDDDLVYNILDLLEKYHSYTVLELGLYKAKNKDITDNDELIFKARMQKIVSQINPSIYEFQLKDLINCIFTHFDDFYSQNFGFTISDAWSFGNKIMKRYENNVRQDIEDSKKNAEELAKKVLSNPKIEKKIRENLIKENLSEKDYIERLRCFFIFNSIKDLFVFNIKKFCKEEKISEIEKFKNYINVFCCSFGESKPDFSSFLDDNIIELKPIIHIEKDNYFVPIPKDLIFNLPKIFEKLLEKEKQKNTRIWQRYQIRKSKYTEDKICDFFSRIFPKNNIHKNVSYTHKGLNGESDILITYDNKLLIIEVKSNNFTEPAKRGAVDRLKSDLKKLVEDAYSQGRKTREYIKSEKIAYFKNKNGKTELKIRYGDEFFDLFLISVTLEPLMSFNTGLKSLQTLGLFTADEFPWSVYLFDLDLVTQYIPSPTIFIHYLEKRLAAQDENVFHAFDEISYLGYYLNIGNFYKPILKDGRTPNLVSIDTDFITIFDNHYLYGKEPPKLNIEPEWNEIIRDLESLDEKGHTNLVSTLLDFEHDARIKIISVMKNIIDKSKKDKKRHNFSTLYKDSYNTGFTFFSQVGRNKLREDLFSFCNLKKYDNKSRKWIGLGVDITDMIYFVNEFIFLDFPWKKDPEIEALVKKNLSK
jgi:hypothetical protein